MPLSASIQGSVSSMVDGRVMLTPASRSRFVKRLIRRAGFDQQTESGRKHFFCKPPSPPSTYDFQGFSPGSCSFFFIYLRPAKITNYNRGISPSRLVRKAEERPVERRFESWSLPPVGTVPYIICLSSRTPYDTQEALMWPGLVMTDRNESTYHLNLNGHHSLPDELICREGQFTTGEWVQTGAF